MRQDKDEKIFNPSEVDYSGSLIAQSTVLYLAFFDIAKVTLIVSDKKKKRERKENLLLG